MLLKDLILMALSSLKANKLRSLLTMFGITIGVFSVLGVMTAIQAVESSIEEGLAELGANTFEITKNPALLFRGPRTKSTRPDFTYQEATEFKRLMKNAPAKIGLETRDRAEKVSFGSIETNPVIDIIGGDQNYITANSYQINYGRNLSNEDLIYARNLAIIGPGVQEKLFPAIDPLNRMITINGKKYRIIGVLKEKGSVFGQSQDDIVLIPITRFLYYYGNLRQMSFTVQASSKAVYQDVMDQSIGSMRIVRGQEPGEENNFSLRTNEALIESFNEVSNTVQIGAFIISVIALLTAGIGIMNIMLVSVTERTKEIGVRKSLGAKNSSVLSQFLIEAVILSELGGLIGIVLGVIGGNLFAAQLNSSLIFPWDWAITGLVVCSAIGIGFGLYPAYKASRLNPVEALRFE
jgi:putative ABC transport system permease protein